MDDLQFNEFYERLRAELFVYALRLCDAYHSAEDLVAEAWLRVYRIFSELEPGLRESDARMRAYVFTALRNLWLDWEVRGVKEASLPPDWEVASEGRGAAQLLIAEEHEERLRQVLALTQTTFPDWARHHGDDVQAPRPSAKQAAFALWVNEPRVQSASVEVRVGVLIAYLATLGFDRRGQLGPNCILWVEGEFPTATATFHRVWWDEYGTEFDPED